MGFGTLFFEVGWFYGDLLVWDFGILGWLPWDLSAR